MIRSVSASAAIQEVTEQSSFTSISLKDSNKNRSVRIDFAMLWNGVKRNLDFDDT